MDLHVMRLAVKQHGTQELDYLLPPMGYPAPCHYISMETLHLSRTEMLSMPISEGISHFQYLESSK